MKRFRAHAWPFLVLVLVGLLLWRESGRDGNWAAQVDESFLDWLSANAGGRGETGPDASSGVTLVEINDAVLSERGRGPLSPYEYALFLQSAETLRPAVTAIEPALSWTPSQPEQERILAARALRVPKLLLGCTLGSALAAGDPEAEEEAAPLLAPLPAGLREVQGDASAFPTFEDLAARPARELAALAAGVGPVNLAGAPPRVVPLVFTCRGRVLPSFALLAAAQWLQLTPADIVVRPGSHIALGDKRRIPIDAAGRMLIDTRAARRVPRTGLDELPLLAQQATESGTSAPPVGNRPLTPGIRSFPLPSPGSVLILGRTDAASRRLAWPDGRAGAPVEWIAAAVAAIQRGDFVWRAPASVEMALLLAFAAAGAWLAGRGRALALTVAGASLGLYALAALVCYGQGRVWLPLALPAGMILGATLLAGTIRGRA